MRKQYNFWPSDDGLDAWDVDRLIELAADVPAEEIAVDTIAEVDSVYWYGFGETPTVRSVVDHARMISDVDLSYPIILGPDGRVMDGMHRIARCLLDGRPTILAKRLAELPEPDYRNTTPSELPYD